MSDIAVPQFRAPKRRKTTAAAHKQPRSLNDRESTSGSDSGHEAEHRTSVVNSRTQVRRKPGVCGVRFSNANLRPAGNVHDDVDSMAVVSTAENVNGASSSTHGLNDRFIVSGSGVGAGRDAMENDPNMYVVPVADSIALWCHVVLEKVGMHDGIPEMPQFDQDYASLSRSPRCSNCTVNTSKTAHP